MPDRLVEQVFATSGATPRPDGVRCWGMPSEEAERALGLADEAFTRFDVDAVVAHLSAAVRAFTAADERCRAAMACARLGDVFANGLGNQTAARAWFARARRLVEDQPPCLEQGWVAVAAMGCDVDDPDQLLAAAELALDRARRFGDVNLETKALADCSTPPAWHPTRPTPCGRWATSVPPPSPSCTARRSRATAGRPSTIWPTGTRRCWPAPETAAAVDRAPVRPRRVVGT
jgi:hypothetical protein